MGLVSAQWNAHVLHVEQLLAMATWRGARPASGLAGDPDPDKGRAAQHMRHDQRRMLRIPTKERGLAPLRTHLRLSVRTGVCGECVFGRVPQNRPRLLLIMMPG